MKNIFLCFSAYYSALTVQIADKHLKHWNTCIDECIRTVTHTRVKKTCCHPKNLISTISLPRSSWRPPFNSYDASFENLALDQLTISLLLFFLLISWGEILSWSLLGVFRVKNLPLILKRLTYFSLGSILSHCF